MLLSNVVRILYIHTHIRRSVNIPLPALILFKYVKVASLRERSGKQSIRRYREQTSDREGNDKKKEKPSSTVYPRYYL